MDYISEIRRGKITNWAWNYGSTLNHEAHVDSIQRYFKLIVSSLRTKIKSLICAISVISDGSLCLNRPFETQFKKLPSACSWENTNWIKALHCTHKIVLSHFWTLIAYHFKYTYYFDILRITNTCYFHFRRNLWQLWKRTPVNKINSQIRAKNSSKTIVPKLPLSRQSNPVLKAACCYRLEQQEDQMTKGLRFAVDYRLWKMGFFEGFRNLF